MLQESRAELAKNNYDLAILLAEQSLQLYLKASVLIKTGSMPHLHPIRELFNLFGDAFPSKKALVNDFIKQHRNLFIRLEDAYLGSRYSFREYDKEEAEDLVTFNEQAIAFLANCEK